MKSSASRGERVAGVLAVAAACAYLLPFVARGWVPHDEGMLGQSADRVLHGAIPFIDYEEPYSGGLSWLYALVFRLRGVDLLNVRWLIFLLGCAIAWLVYLIARRFLNPLGAAVAAWVAVVWSLPNYFAGLPSWWLLGCALACLWAIARYAEAGQLRDLFIAGLAAGFAVAVKQTGLYLVVALAATVAFAFGPPVLRWATALAAGGAATALLGPRILDAEGFYLLLPIVICALALLVPAPRPRRSLTPIVAAAAGVAIPIALLLAPYLLRGRLWDFVNGAVLLPQKRLAFASAPMHGSWFAVAAAPLAALVLFPRASRIISASRIARALVWTMALLLPLAALINVASYQMIWQSARAIAAILPIAICSRIASGSVADPSQRLVLFASAAILSWLSLNQYPFAAPIYFSYVTPIAVLCAVALASATGAAGRDAMLPWAILLIMFGVLSANRGYIENLGVAHEVRRFDAPLDLPRARLMVGEGDARGYRGVMASIASHYRGGTLVAGPDCPEVYFLAGLFNPSGALFDFFAGDAAEEDAARWLKADLIIVNHAPHFTPKPSDALLATLRQEFAHGEDVGRFEIRWR